MSRRAFSLIELLIVIAIIAILMGLLFPAVRRGYDMSGRQSCKDNLKKMGIGLHAYYDVYGCFPPPKINSGVINSTPPAAELGKFDFYGSGVYKVYNHTGFTLILPFIGEDHLYQKYRFDYAVCDAAFKGAFVHADLAGSGVDACPGDANAEVVSTYVSTYRCPSDVDPITDTITNTMKGDNQFFLCRNARRSNYGFCIFSVPWEWFTYPQYGIIYDFFNTYGMLDMKRGMFCDNSRTRISEITHGTGCTIAIGELKQTHVGKEIWETLLRSFPLANHWGVGSEASCTMAMTRFTLTAPYRMHINFQAGSEAGPVLPGNPNYGLQYTFGAGSYHDGGANFLFADGGVRFLRNSMSNPVYQALGTMNSSESIGSESQW